MDTTNVKRVSDIIPRSEIKKWTNGDVITIRAGTGAGKSYFIKNDLYDYAKEHGMKILMLIHRENCVEQFKLEIERDHKSDVIDIRTYQSIEHKILYRTTIDLSSYQYIVCDEFHYFLTDAGFNRTTDVSFDHIMSQEQAIRIFMSATGSNIKDYITNKRNIQAIDYQLPVSYPYISQLNFFYRDDSMEEFAKRVIESGEKAIFFIQKATSAYKLYKKFKKYSLFNCSKNNRQYYKYVDADKIKKMLQDEKFSEQLLITTSCFDAGANIVDESVRHIIVDMTDVDSVVQCAGRKRIQSEQDNFSLYIRVINNLQLGGLESSTKKKIRMAKYLLDHSTEDLLKKFPRQQDGIGIIYDEVENGSVVKRVNQLMYRKKQVDIKTYHEMKTLGDFGYCKYIAKLFGFYNEKTDRYLYNVAQENFALESYLENMVGEVMLNRADRKELIDKLNVRSDGHLLKGIDVLNDALEERGIQYRIEEFKTSRLIDGKKKNYNSAWRVYNTEDKKEKEIA